MNLFCCMLMWYKVCMVQMNEQIYKCHQTCMYPKCEKARLMCDKCDKNVSATSIKIPDTQHNVMGTLRKK